RKRIRHDAHGAQPSPDAQAARNRPDREQSDPDLELVKSADRRAERKQLNEDNEGMKDEGLAERLWYSESDPRIPEGIVARKELPALKHGRRDLLPKAFVVRRQ